MSEVIDVEGRTIRTDRAYNVALTASEMQYLANGITAFFNVMRRDKVQIKPEQIQSLVQTMEKLKLALNTANNYRVVQIVS